MGNRRVYFCEVPYIFFNHLSTSNLKYMGNIAVYLFLFMPLFHQTAEKAKCPDAF